MVRGEEDSEETYAALDKLAEDVRLVQSQGIKVNGVDVKCEFSAALDLVSYQKLIKGDLRSYLTPHGEVCFRCLVRKDELVKSMASDEERCIRHYQYVSRGIELS